MFFGNLVDDTENTRGHLESANMACQVWSLYPHTRSIQTLAAAVE